MSPRPLHLLIDDILEAVAKIERYITSSTAETFPHEEKTLDAVVRNLEIIGEASRHIPDGSENGTGLINGGGGRNVQYVPLPQAISVDSMRDHPSRLRKRTWDERPFPQGSGFRRYQLPH